MPASRSPTLAELLQVAIQSRTGELRVALPAKVLSYNAVQQSVDVQPQLRGQVEQPDGEVASVRLPVINSVPVVFPGAGGFRLTFPVQAGDTCLLIFSDGSLDKWLTDGAEADVQDGRQHALPDAVAIMGLHPFNANWTGASTSEMTAGKDGGPQINFRDATIGLNGGAAESVILGNSYRTAEDTLFLAIQTFMNAVGAMLATPAITGSIATFTTTKTAFDVASAAFLSSIVKVQ